MYSSIRVSFGSSMIASGNVDGFIFTTASNSNVKYSHDILLWIVCFPIVNIGSNFVKESNPNIRTFCNVILVSVNVSCPSNKIPSVSNGNSDNSNVNAAFSSST